MKSKEKDVTSVCPRKVGRICILLFSELLIPLGAFFHEPEKGRSRRGGSAAALLRGHLGRHAEEHLGERETLLRRKLIAGLSGADVDDGSVIDASTSPTVYTHRWLVADVHDLAVEPRVP